MVSKKEDIKCQQFFANPHEHLKNHLYFLSSHPHEHCKNYFFLVVMNLSTKCSQDGRDSNKIRGHKASKMSDVSGGGGDGMGEKNYHVELMESVGSADDKSGGSGVALFMVFQRLM